jgi:hypothetical protein
LVSEASSPPEIGDDASVERDVIAAADETIEALAPELCRLSVPKVAAFFPTEPPTEQPILSEGASFFGTEAPGHQFVYVVDTSPSMNIGLGRGPGGASRLIRALAELRASIQRLSPEHAFYVILFNGRTRRMFDDNTIRPQALAATPENKHRLDDWLVSVRTGESTDPRPALRLGLAMRPSAVFLLSDGLFDVPEASVLEVINRHNFGGTPIYTIAYEDDRCCLTMQRIALATAGEYRFVAAPSRTRGP